MPSTMERTAESPAFCFAFALPALPLLCLLLCLRSALALVVAIAVVVAVAVAVVVVVVVIVCSCRHPEQRAQPGVEGPRRTLRRHSHQNRFNPYPQHLSKCPPPFPFPDHHLQLFSAKTAQKAHVKPTNLAKTAT